MWIFIIIVIAVALVVGPAMMMRPSPAQKNKARLRALALAKNIRVTVRNLPQQPTESEQPFPVPVYFIAPTDHQLNDDWFLLRASYTHEIHFLDSWAWQGDLRATEKEQAALQKYLPVLPESVRGVSVGSKGVCVYWQERGGDRVLLQIIELLEVLNALQIKPKEQV
ncbi:MAG: hypothetical protein V4732_14175 [Pseudomonadota bacterium]